MTRPTIDRENTHTFEVKAVADSQVPARAMIERTTHRSPNRVTVKKHPANWRRDLKQASVMKRYAIEFEVWNITGIIEQIDIQT